MLLKSISELITLGDEARIGLNEVDFGGESFETRLVYVIDGGAFSDVVFVWPGGREGAALGIRG